jgi:hypothetical protein
MRVYLVAVDGCGAAEEWCEGCGEAFAYMACLLDAARLVHARTPKLYAGW